jgi:hypothetical protein
MPISPIHALVDENIIILIKCCERKWIVVS